MNNILCPVDFSDASLTAVEFAVKIAKRHSTSIKLIHIITEAEYSRDLDKSQNYYKNIEEEPGQNYEIESLPEYK